MSSIRITIRIILWLCVASVGAELFALQAAPGARGTGAHRANPAEIFQHGQQALGNGRLEEAEKDFRRVLQIDPQAGAAYANLGVVYMRQKQWNTALGELEKAKKLMPQVAGIRLNIGLAYYRQNEFLKASPPFESVMRDEPDATQPRYLLGLCYFFAERWGDAADTLAPLWAEESGKLPYLYVLSNAAHHAGRGELDTRASEQFLKVGNDSPEYHLFAAKYHLNREEYDQAITELGLAEKADPSLAFVHFYLGLAHLGKQEYAEARDEFLKDAAVEPDLALNYSELGDVYWQMQDDPNAEKSYREAIRRDLRLVDPHLGLAKIYQRQRKFPAAMAEADAAVKLDPDRTDAHYVRGQVLLRLGRKVEARKELEAAAANPKKPSVPSPELIEDPQ